MNWKLNTDAWISVAKGAGIAAAGAALTYLTAHVGDLDLGAAAPLVTAGLGVLVNYLRKVVTA